MIIKIGLYIIIVPLIIRILDGIDIAKIFRRDRLTEAKIFSLIICLILSYLLVEFLLDFTSTFSMQ